MYIIFTYKSSINVIFHYSTFEKDIYNNSKRSLNFGGTQLRNHKTNGCIKAGVLDSRDVANVSRAVAHRHDAPHNPSLLQTIVHKIHPTG